MPATTVTIRPNAQGNYNNWTAWDGHSTKYVIVADQDNTTRVDPSGGADPETYGFSDIASPGGSLVSQVVVHIRLLLPSTGVNYQLRARLNGTDVDGVNTGCGATTGTADFSEDFTLKKPGGGAWTVNDINACEFGFALLNWSASQPECAEIWVEVTYDPIPSLLEKVRIVATQRAIMRRVARSLPGARCVLPLADVELGTLIPWSRRDAPAEDGLGWQEKRWQRRLTRVIQTSLNLNTLEVTVATEDVREQLMMLYDEGRSFITSRSISDGIGRIYVGTRTWARSSKACVDDPSDGTVREVGYDIDQINGGDTPGTLVENSSTNELLRSSAISGLTGVTTFGTGTNGSAIATDSTDLLFETAVTAQSWKLTAGVPHAADQGITWPATGSWAANTKGRLSIDYKNDSSGTLYWRLQRGIDSKYWDDSAGTWGAAVNNALTVSATRKRGVSGKRIDVGAGATTLTLSVVQLSGGTSSRVDHVYHVQLEKLAWATSRMPTDASTTTRAKGSLTYSNASGAQNFYNTRGTFFMEVVPEYSAADVSGLNAFSMAAVYFDANNIWAFFYDPATAAVYCNAFAGGVSHLASCAWSPVRGQASKLAFRFTSSEGELDLTAGTLSVFVDGVKGTDVVFGAPPTEVLPSTIYVGLDYNASAWASNCAVRRVRFTQQVLTDIEIARL